jgi:N-acetyl-gamma-glutamyl-phosphate reductase
MIRVAILGARGYTALEVLKILLRHPGAQVVALTTRDDDRPHLSAVHPQLAGRLDLVLENLSPAEVAERADFAFTCLPHAASAKTASELLALGVKVVDFSADYRLSDAASYRQWYGIEHPDAGRLGKTPYGLPELFREQVRIAPLVANPGCYPTSAILALAPLIREKLIDLQSIIVDSKSGVSGAGREPKAHLHFPECNESVSAYNVGVHRHMPEIDRVLGQVAKEEVRVVFTPHLIPMDRGILTTAYAQPRRTVSSEQLISLYKDFYRGEPFVRVTEGLPATKDVAHTNFCNITVREVRGRIVAISAIDNLIKGASGAAVQNLNVMHGLTETTALL